MTSDNTFFLLKKKSKKEIKEIDFGTVLHRSNVIVKYFETLEKLDDFSKINIDKFHYLIGYCGENEKAEEFI